MADEGKRPLAAEAARAAAGWNGQFESLLSANERAFRSWADGIRAFADEIAQFTKTRLSEDTETWQVMATCKSPIDALECQRRYTERAAAQYFEEAGKLTQLAMGLASAGLSSLQNAAKAPAQRSA